MGLFWFLLFAPSVLLDLYISFLSQGVFRHYFFSAIIYFLLWNQNKISALFSLSSPGSPMMRIWNHLMLSHKSLKLSSFFFFFLLLWLGEFHCLSLSWLMVPLLHLICCWTHVVYFFSLYSLALWLLLDTFLYWVGQKFIQSVNTLFNKVLGERE